MYQYNVAWSSSSETAFAHLISLAGYSFDVIFHSLGSFAPNLYVALTDVITRLTEEEDRPLAIK